MGGLPFDPAALDGVEGWLSEDQARRLWDAAAALEPPGRIVEIGSFRGRSTIVLARAAPEGVEVVAIDPHAGTDRGPQEIETSAATGEADHERFLANLERAGVRERVRHVRAFSQDALRERSRASSTCSTWTAPTATARRATTSCAGARASGPAGRMLIHDSFSSVGVTLAILRHLVWSRDFAYVGRTASLAEYRRAEAGPGSAVRQLAQLPWFARNMLVKLALVLRLRSGDWPY